MSDKVGELEIEVNCETSGLDDAIDKVGELQELTQDFAPLVSIRNCRGCTFYIYPSSNTWRAYDDDRDR